MVAFCAVAKLMDWVHIASDILNHVRQQQPKEHKTEERPGNMTCPNRTGISENLKLHAKRSFKEKIFVWDLFMDLDK